jgi:hypothetical protein
MVTKQIQLAHLYDGDKFLGYGLAVDGALLGMQSHTSIHTRSGRKPVIEAHFYMSAEMENETPLKIQVGK